MNKPVVTELRAGPFIRGGSHNTLLQTMDARRWADSFEATFPQANVEYGIMLTWFANAITTGYNHRYWQSPEYRRTIRRARYAWWNWRRYIEVKPKETQA